MRDGFIWALLAAAVATASCAALVLKRGGSLDPSSVQPLVDGLASSREGILINRKNNDRQQEEKNGDTTGAPSIFLPREVAATAGGVTHPRSDVSPYSEEDDTPLGDCVPLSRDIGAATHSFGLRALLAAIDLSNGGSGDATINARKSVRKPLFISPVSVAMAMGLALQGARDNDAEAASRAMGVSVGRDGIKAEHWARCLGEGSGGRGDAPRAVAARALGDLARYLAPPGGLEKKNKNKMGEGGGGGGGGGGTVSIANAVWVDAKAQLDPSFEEVADGHFGGEVHQTRFGGSGTATRDIDAWVSDRTHGMIPSLDAHFPASTRAVITNAVYFDVAWERAFDPRLTRQAQFARGDTEERPELADAKYLCADGKYPYGESPLFQAVAVPYTSAGEPGTPSYEALFILPKKLGTEAQVLRQIAGHPADLIAFRESFAVRKGHVEIPKVSGMTTTLEMSRVLARLGFDPSAARFDGIVREGDVRVSEVLHKTVLDMSEQGTKAAAVTAITMRAMVRPAIPIDPPFQFLAHHPVILIIRDIHTSAALFAGIVTV